MKTLCGLSILLVSMSTTCGGQKKAEPPPPTRLTITEPRSSAEVGCIIEVSGSSATASEVIWVVVNPQAPQSADKFYAQRPARVSSDGSWTTSQVHIADCTDQFKGQGFRIKAIANPSPQPSVGQVLSDWPQGSRTSDTINVVRKD